MVELHRIEERILWLESLRKSFNSDTSKNQAYKSMVRSEGGRMLIVDLIVKYVNILDETSKNQKEVQFYENRGRLKILDWLLNLIKESSDSKEV